MLQLVEPQLPSGSALSAVNVLTPSPGLQTGVVLCKDKSWNVHDLNHCNRNHVMDDLISNKWAFDKILETECFVYVCVCDI